MALEDKMRAAETASARYTRREVLKTGGVLGLALSFGPMLGACGSSSSSSAPSPSGSAAEGGRLIVGAAGGSAKDSLDAHVVVQQIDSARAIALYEPLLLHDANNIVVPALAEEMTPSKNGQVWTIRLREDIEFHNGKTITADDVVFSFRRMVDPETASTGHTQLDSLKADGIEKIDERTVRFTLTEPNSVLDDVVASYYMGIVPVDYDPQNPVGSGPFVYKSFTPGEKSLFTAFKNYYGEGPHVDELEIVDFADDTARVNALMGGSVDCISQVPRAQMELITSQPGFEILRSETGAWLPFTMNVETKPYSDVRVRQAFRLIVDRPQMVKLALDDLGRIGNDLFAPLDPLYNSSLPQRVQDLEQAKSLLKQAGHEGLSVELVTSDVATGVVEAAQIFQQQAEDAGVKVSIKKVDGAVFYGDQYRKWPFAQDYWYTRNYLPQVVRSYYPTGPGNETHFRTPELMSLIKEAFRTVDQDKRKELIWAAQEIEYNEGAYIIWGFNDQIDAYNKKVTGLVPDKSGIPLSNFHFNKVRIS